MSLTKDQILAVDDVKIVKVPVPEWGGDVFVKTLLASQRTEIMDLMNKETGRVSFARLLALTLVDENGNSLGFTGDELEKKSLNVIVRIGMEAMKINGMVKEAVDEAGKN